MSQLPSNDHQDLESPLREVVAQIVTKPIPSAAMARAVEGAAASDFHAAGRLSRLTVPQRIAVGSLGLSAMLGLVLFLLAWNSVTQLSAMERMVKELHQITSYSCLSAGTNTGVDDDGKRVTIKDQATARWLAPGAYYQKTKISRIVEDVGGGNRNEEIVQDLEESFPLGKPGALIDHRCKTFVRMPYNPTDEPIGSKTYPWEFLRLIREGSYDVVRDLGTKRSGDTNVHGYQLTLKNQRNRKALDAPLELWVDSQTNLPVDISWSGESDGWKSSNRTTDFHWNIALDPKQFEPEIPQSYADITPPSDQKDLDQIVAALRLYSQLSGGHYPRTKTIDPAIIRDEMLKTVDTPANSVAARDKLREQIDQAMPGLNWIARILRNRYVSGYRGLNVGPSDKQKALLWWIVEDRYRVLYGDLRAETVSDAKAVTLGLTEAGPNMPEDEQVPNKNR